MQLKEKKFIEIIIVWDEFLWLVVNALISPIDNEVAIKSNKFHKILGFAIIVKLMNH